MKTYYVLANQFPENHFISIKKEFKKRTKKQRILNNQNGKNIKEIKKINKEKLQS